MIKLGIIGLGRMGQRHLANYLKISDVKVVALASKNDETINHLLSEHKLKTSEIKIYKDYSEICSDKSIDAISINLPSYMHAEIAIKALQNNKHVFCEKPIDLNIGKAKQMIDLAKSKNKILLIGHVLRFWPEYLKAYEIIKSQKYGKVLAANFTRCRGLPNWDTNNWFSKKEKSGGVAIDLHIHDADLCVWWWGKPDKINAQGNQNIIFSTWEYNNGPVIQFDSTWEPASKLPFYFGFKIILEKASIIFDSRNDSGLQLATNKEFKQLEISKHNPYLRLSQYFIDCIKNKKQNDICPPSESLLALECAIETNKQIHFYRDFNYLFI